MAVNLIWTKYDVDKVGALDFVQARLFMEEVLNATDERLEVSEGKFRQTFDLYDTGRSGQLNQE